MREHTRRRFIKGAVTAASGLGIAGSLPYSTWAKPEGSNEDLRLGIIGCRRKGKQHIDHLKTLKGVRIVAICDVDQQVLDEILAEFKGEKRKVASYVDYRKLLENPDIDGVVIVTPNHLHSMIAIHSVQAGKHVYVEKPVSHNIWEGRQLVAASEKYGKIIHHGMQRRSDVGWHEAFAWLKEGHIGKVTLARALAYRKLRSIGKVSSAQAVPSHVDYNLWCGPRKMKPVMRQQFHFDWHWQWDYGNGEIGNLAPHSIDVARWSLGEGYEKLPERVLSIGGRFGYDDDGETPNTQLAFYDYKPAPIILEIRGLPLKKMDWKGGVSHFKGIRFGTVVHCEGGYLTGAMAYDKKGKRIRTFPVTKGEGHMENWIQSLRDGKQSKHNTALVGHLTAGLVHASNISYLVGKQAAPGAITEALKENAPNLESFERFKEHLGANGIDLEKDKAVLGASLSIDPKTETFVGPFAEKANKQRKGFYREPFTVPELV